MSATSWSETRSYFCKPVKGWPCGLGHSGDPPLSLVPTTLVQKPTHHGRLPSSVPAVQESLGLGQVSLFLIPPCPINED